MLIPEILTLKLVDALNGIDDPREATATLYDTLCDYVETHAQATYAWTAVDPAGAPDPSVLILATIDTGFMGKIGDVSGVMSLKPSEVNTPEDALRRLSEDLRLRCKTWKIEWPSGYELTKATVNPLLLSRLMVPSYATDQYSALLDFSTKFLLGIRLATISATGTHNPGSFVGTATFTAII